MHVFGCTGPWTFLLCSWRAEYSARQWMPRNDKNKAEVALSPDMRLKFAIIRFYRSAEISEMSDKDMHHAHIQELYWLLQAPTEAWVLWMIQNPWLDLCWPCTSLFYLTAIWKCDAISKGPIKCSHRWFPSWQGPRPHVLHLQLSIPAAVIRYTEKVDLEQSTTVHNLQ